VKFVNGLLIQSAATRLPGGSISAKVVSPVDSGGRDLLSPRWDESFHEGDATMTANIFGTRTIAMALAIVLSAVWASQGVAQNQYNPYPTISTSSIPAPPSIGLPAEPTGEAATDTTASTSLLSFPLFRRIAAGGWLMVPLGLCSLVVFSLSLERAISLRRSRVIPRPFVRRFTECVEDGQLSYEEASAICEEFDCPVAEVFKAAVKRWGRPMMEIEQAVMDAGDRVADGLRRFLRVFHAISNVAPLIGLLGTVLGMISAFESMSGSTTGGNPESLAAGISTALITTAGGLCVAIPAYLAYMYFGSQSDRYLNEIDRLCQRVIDCISAEGLEGGARKQKVRRAG